MVEISLYPFRIFDCIRRQAILPFCVCRWIGPPVQRLTVTSCSHVSPCIGCSRRFHFSGQKQNAKKYNHDKYNVTVTQLLEPIAATWISVDMFHCIQCIPTNPFTALGFDCYVLLFFFLNLYTISQKENSVLIYYFDGFQFKCGFGNY